MTSRPLPAIWTTFGTTASNVATRKLNLPGTLNLTLPLSRPKASTPRSKVPSTPIRSTVTPELLCGVVAGGGPVVVAGVPKASDARSTPIAIVSTSMPSGLKPTSAIPIVGVCSVSGPSWIVPVAGSAPGAAGESVKVWLSPARLRVPVVVLKLSVSVLKNSTVIAPAWKRPIAFLVSLSLR